MNGTENHYDANKVLSENVRHHIKEEEGDILPKARSLQIDFEKVGQQMLKRKKALIARGIPRVGEENMVAASRGKGDSPAKAARKTRIPSKRKKGDSRGPFPPRGSK